MQSKMTSPIPRNFEKNRQSLAIFQLCSADLLPYHIFFSPDNVLNGKINRQSLLTLELNCADLFQFDDFFPHSFVIYTGPRPNPSNFGLLGHALQF